MTREGFDLSRHAWSQLSNGDLGWLQITNFVVVGLMTVTEAIGLGRALPGGLGATWAGRLLAVPGVSLIAAGASAPTPAPAWSDRPPSRSSPGTGCCTSSPAASDSWPSSRACLVVARRYAAEGQRALFSRIAGVWLLVAFIGVAAGAGRSATVLAFVTAVILAWTWRIPSLSTGTAAWAVPRPGTINPY